MNCVFEFEIGKSAALYEWAGPKFGREMWNEVLAFFRWTQATTKSESQVRLYVNYITREWKAWAYPQTLGTGMTTREISNDDSKSQRAQFSDADGWLYYGTVHHHCNSSAFQSSVDEANERDQDGIHITVGFMEKQQYDIDIRLYQSGCKITDFQICAFWDTGDVYADLPNHVKSFLPKNYPEQMAMLQMGTPPPIEQQFPDLWKTNLIRELRVSPVSSYSHSGDYHSGFTGGGVTRPFTERSAMETDFDKRRFMSDMLKWMVGKECQELKWGLDEIQEILINVKDKFPTPAHLDVVDIMVRNDIRPERALKILVEIDDRIRESVEEKELEKELGKSKGRNPNQLGLPLAAGNGVKISDDDVMEYEGGSHYAHYGMGHGLGG